MENEKQEPDNVDPINYGKEWDYVLHSLEAAKKLVKVQKVLATLENFESVLGRDTRFLHFSCHGCTRQVKVEVEKPKQPKSGFLTQK